MVLAAVRSLQEKYRQAIQQEDRATMELIQAGDVHAAIVAVTERGPEQERFPAHLA